MKSMYDKNQRYSPESHDLNLELQAAIRPIMDKYIERGYGYRELHSLALKAVFEMELDYAFDGLGEKQARESEQV